MRRCICRWTLPKLASEAVSMGIEILPRAALVGFENDRAGFVGVCIRFQADAKSRGSLGGTDEVEIVIGSGGVGSEAAGGVGLIFGVHVPEDVKLLICGAGGGVRAALARGSFLPPSP